MPRKKTPKACACGCGEMTKGGHWISGHDASYMRGVHAEVHAVFPQLENVTLFIGEQIKGLCAGQRMDRIMGDTYDD